MNGLGRHLTHVLETALSSLSFETPGPALFGAAERVATEALLRERAAGRIRGFRVACGLEQNPDGPEGLAVDVVVQPPGPRVASVALRVVAR